MPGDLFLLLQRVAIWFPVPLSASSQLPVTSAPGASDELLSLGTCTHVHVLLLLHIQIIKFKKQEGEGPSTFRKNQEVSYKNCSGEALRAFRGRHSPFR